MVKKLDKLLALTGETRESKAKVYTVAELKKLLRITLVKSPHFPAD